MTDRILISIDRQTAKKRGLPRFYTGALCKYGHDDERVTSSGNCLSCQRNHNKRHYSASLSQRRKSDLKEKVKMNDLNYRERNREEIATRQRARYQLNKDRRRKQRKEYCLRHPDRVAASNKLMVAEKSTGMANSTAQTANA